jgi:Fe-S-cluster containining protein
MNANPAQAQHPCARCAEMQKTCCQNAEVLLTPGDVRRIEAHVGRGDFHEWRRPEDPTYLDQDEDDPNWYRATVAADGTRHVLRRRSDGDCTFLGPKGCTLALEVRPLICRIYPYSFTESGLTGEDADYCPTRLLGDRNGSMLSTLGMDPSSAEQWRRQLYEELHEELAAR